MAFDMVKKAGPASIAFVFHAGIEQFQITASADVYARPPLMIQDAGGSDLRLSFAQNLINIGRQPAFPFLV